MVLTHFAHEQRYFQAGTAFVFLLRTARTQGQGNDLLHQSKKDVTKFKTRRHNAFRAEVTYNGVKYRKRSTDPEDCKKFLEEMALKYDKGLL